MRAWISGMRFHQWLKNLLVFLPLLASHRFLEGSAVLHAACAFLLFGACASSVYLINDLLDIGADRLHARKRTRPFAAGEIPLIQGIVIAPMLAVASLVLAFFVSPQFQLVLALYFLMTLSYSLRLKRVVMVDVVLLAGLYTVRIIAGAAAIGSPLSFWLLAFSMFLFLSLAMLKRYIELRSMQALGREGASGRGYNVDDLTLMQSLGSSSGYISVMVLALYINSPESLQLYTHPKMLWLLCPALLYWISRIWVVAHRGAMHDDPVVYAATDRVSQVVILIGAAIALSAI